MACWPCESPTVVSEGLVRALGKGGALQAGEPHLGSHSGLTGPGDFPVCFGLSSISLLGS